MLACVSCDSNNYNMYRKKGHCTCLETARITQQLVDRCNERHGNEVQQTLHMQILERTSYYSRHSTSPLCWAATCTPRSTGCQHHWWVVACMNHPQFPRRTFLQESPGSRGSFAQDTCYRHSRSQHSPLQLFHQSLGVPWHRRIPRFLLVAR